MKGKYADRPCTICKTITPGKEKYCPKCGRRVGRVNINPKNPGSYKGYVKEYRI